LLLIAPLDGDHFEINLNSNQDRSASTMVDDNGGMADASENRPHR